jgi:hexosaminidase
MRAIGYVSILILLSCALRTGAQTEGVNATLVASRRNLMPVPASVRFNAGRLAVNKSFSVAARGYVDDRLRSGIARALRRLEGRTVLEFPQGLAADANTATLVVECQKPGQIVPSVDEDESYSLEVTDRQAQLRAPTVVGALRGLETFLQLVEGDRDGYFVPAVQIKDAPRFRWRGLLIDVGRHYEPLEVLKRNLDAMAAIKLNVFHWHLTEDQGFRIESKKFPKLTGLGSDGLFYTQDGSQHELARRLPGVGERAGAL